MNETDGSLQPWEAGAAVRMLPVQLRDEYAEDDRLGFPKQNLIYKANKYTICNKIY